MSSVFFDHPLYKIAMKFLSSPIPKNKLPQYYHLNSKGGTGKRHVQELWNHHDIKIKNIKLSWNCLNLQDLAVNNIQAFLEKIFPSTCDSCHYWIMSNESFFTLTVFLKRWRLLFNRMAKKGVFFRFYNGLMGF